MSSGSELGAYLRARRDVTRPGDVGLAVAGRRRVPGLRREELAQLAGISGEYYLRLEQGRDQHPSSHVLDSIARALRLGPEATDYLHLVALPPPPRPPSDPGPAGPEHVADGVRSLVESRTDIAAVVLGRYQDVLAANDLAGALDPEHTPGTNLVCAAFLDPATRSLYGSGWHSYAVAVVAALRALAGPESRDPHLAELVAELSAASDDFPPIWARHDVASRIGGSHVLHHPEVGTISAFCEKLLINGSAGQILVLYHTVPGTDAAVALSRLAARRAERGQLQD